MSTASADWRRIDRNRYHEAVGEHENEDRCKSSGLV
jgi:hypothetical protein